MSEQPPQQPAASQPPVDRRASLRRPAARPARRPAAARASPAYAPAPAAPAQPAYAPAALRRPSPATATRRAVHPSARAHGAGRSGGFFKSSRGKTIGLIVAGVVAVGALGGIGAAIFGGDDDEAFPTRPTGGTVEPGEEVTPEPTAASSARARSARPRPSPTDGSEPTEPSPTEEPSPVTPTEGASPTLDPEPSGDVVTIGNGVQVPVLPGWQVVGQGDSDVLLGDNQNSFVYAVTGTVDPSADAASVIAASIDSILPKQTYTQLRKTDIAPLQAFGSVVSIAAMQYQATWTDQQAVGAAAGAADLRGPAGRHGGHHHRRARPAGGVQGQLRVVGPGGQRDAGPVRRRLTARRQSTRCVSGPPGVPREPCRRRTSERQHEGGGDRGDALAAAGEAEAVGGGRRDGDGRAGGVAERGLGLGAARPEARAVADHLDGDVADREAGLADAGGGLGEQGDAGRAGPRAGRTVPKCAAEVAEAGGRQQRVAGRVRGDVSVGVTLEAVVLVGPGEPGEVHRARRRARRCTSTPMPTRRQRRHRAVRRRHPHGDHA